MSQSTANELLNTLGMTAAGVDHPKARTESQVASTGARKLLIVLASFAVLGTGMKMVGDYACDRAIDSWAARKSAPFTVADPATVALFEKWAAEPESDNDVALDSKNTAPAAQ
jgi:hypothetical protein